MGILESTEISASEEPNGLEKAPVQFMALWILSGKAQFSLWHMDIKQEGTSSVYTISEIKWKNQFSSFILHNN